MPGGSHRWALSLYIEVGFWACHILMWGSVRVVRDKHGGACMRVSRLLVLGLCGCAGVDHYQPVYQVPVSYQPVPRAPVSGGVIVSEPVESVEVSPPAPPVPAVSPSPFKEVPPKGKDLPPALEAVPPKG